MTTLADHVRALRHSRRMSQAQLSSATDVPQTSISNIEGGKTRLPSVDHRRRLATALGTSNVELLLAAKEVDEEELAAWARQSGFARQDPRKDDGELSKLAAELAMEDPESPRVALALQIPLMIFVEADFLTNTFNLLPTDAQVARKELPPEEYRAWRDTRDTEDRNAKVKKEL